MTCIRPTRGNSARQTPLSLLSLQGPYQHILFEVFTCTSLSPPIKGLHSEPQNHISCIVCPSKTNKLHSLSTFQNTHRLFRDMLLSSTFSDRTPDKAVDTMQRRSACLACLDLLLKPHVEGRNHGLGSRKLEPASKSWKHTRSIVL